LHNRAKYGEDVRCAIVTQPYHRGRRKVPVGRIDDRATGGKWNPVRGGNPGRNVGFRIDGRRARLGVKPVLFRGIRDWGIQSDNIRVYGARKRLKKSPCPYVVGQIQFLAGSDSSPNNQISGSELRRQAASNSKADDARSTTRDRRLESGDELRTLVADHRHPGAQGDASLQR
jgi:hypothetical protein